MGVAFFVGRELVRADVENIRKPGMDRQATIRRAEQVIARWIDLGAPIELDASRAAALGTR